MYAVCDCDSFFASCERVFRPELYGRPVVVLSNNDGCIVALTKEAKAIGLKRGTPYFQIKKLCSDNDVAIFSCNFHLYGDISTRVMQILREEFGHIEIYSIDEAFFTVPQATEKQLHESLTAIRQKIFKGIGVPVSIGVAPTRTLAKIASHFAKKYSGYKGVCIIDTEEKRKKALSLTPVGDVWGIGRKINAELAKMGITTAEHFCSLSEQWIRGRFHVTGLQTMKELQGTPCKNIDIIAEKQTICVSRSFGVSTSNYESLTESIISFASQAAERLRRQNSVAQYVSVFIQTNYANLELPQYGNIKTISFPVQTSFTSEIIDGALKALKLIYLPDFLYKKSGVILGGISPNTSIQQNLFDKRNRSKLSKLSSTIDALNKNIGSKSVHLAIEGSRQTDWISKSERKSPDYTKIGDDMMIVKA